MDVFEIQNCLDSMIILYDTREQKTSRASKRYESFGCKSVRQHLDYGDYTYNFMFPDGEWLYEMGEDKIVFPSVSIERKASLTELSNNLIQKKQTFEEEFSRATKHGARIYLLVEEGNFEKIYSGRYGTKVHPNAYKASLFALIARYRISGPIFCRQELSGKVIYDILYRELKERLECGEYG